MDTIFLTADILLDGSDIFLASGPNGLPSITTDIEIQGGGHSISRDTAATAFRIIHVAETGRLKLNRLTVRDGLINSGFDNGGGIFNAGLLEVRESSVRNNHVESIFPAGGGIFNQGRTHHHQWFYFQ